MSEYIMRESGYPGRLETEIVGELIRCRDCKHRYVDGDGVRYNVCELNHNKVQSDDWFCADAERKEGEADG